LQLTDTGSDMLSALAQNCELVLHQASSIMLPGPSLTEGYPATNPALRLLKFDANTYDLQDVITCVVFVDVCST